MIYLHTKYQKPTLKDETAGVPTRNKLFKTYYLILRSKVKVKGHQLGTRHTVFIWSTYISNIKSLHQKMKQKWSGQEISFSKPIIWPWGQRSRSKVTKLGTRHIVYIWSTYMPNIKVLCQQTIKATPSTTWYDRSKFELWTLGTLVDSKMSLSHSAHGGLTKHFCHMRPMVNLLSIFHRCIICINK